jgi:hypothetical protein
MKKSLVLLLLLLLLSGCAAVSLPKKEVTLGSQKVILEIADTLQTREQGLSGRKKLCSNCGLLFVFPKSDRYVFWMKDMNFPLDLIWLQDGVIKEISAQVPVFNADGEITQLQASEAVNQVIEIKAGLAQAWGLAVGQKIEELAP